jgi:hypothetical protein
MPQHSHTDPGPGQVQGGRADGRLLTGRAPKEGQGRAPSSWPWAQHRILTASPPLRPQAIVRAAGLQALPRLNRGRVMVARVAARGRQSMRAALRMLLTVRQADKSGEFQCHATTCAPPHEHSPHPKSKLVTMVKGGLSSPAKSSHVTSRHIMSCHVVAHPAASSYAHA